MWYMSINIWITYTKINTQLKEGEAQLAVITAQLQR